MKKDAPDTDQPGENADGLPKLVDLTYSVTTNPGNYDELLNVWEGYMASLQPDEVADAERHHLRHFNQALEIFDRIGRQQEQRAHIDAVIALFDTPAYLVAQNGTVLQSNGHTLENRLAIRDDSGSLDHLLDTTALRQAIADIQNGAPVALIPVHDRTDQLADCVVVSRLESAAEAYADSYLVVLSNPQISVDQLSRISEKFGLSASESEVFAALLNGHKVSEISTERGVGEATTRTQVRRILEKTGCADLSDLIRRSTRINAQLSAVSMAQKYSGGQTRPPVTYDRILSADGRLIAYRDFGDPRGRPVLFIHNMIGGAIWPRTMEALAEARGWRIIAPSRPGFGLSDRIGAQGMELVRRTCLDMRALLDHLRVHRVLVIGMISSAGLGIRFCKDHPDRVSGLLNVAHAGLMDDGMINAMVNPPRTMAKTFRKSPAALRFLTRVALASVDMLGPEQMLRSNFTRSKADERLLQDKALVGAIGEGLCHAIAQGSDAFSRDGFIALSDWGKDFAGVSCPALCLLGDEDPVYPVKEARRLMADIEGYELEVFENAGQFVFYDKFAETLDLMETLLNKVPQKISD